MKKSESIKEISIAIVEMQSKLKNPKNTAVNPFFKSKYAPLSEILNEVRPLLSEHGLSILQDVETAEHGIKVSTMLLHKSGEWIEQSGVTLKMDKDTAQGAGSAITYARRYVLSAMLGLSSEDDDDGNAAEPKKPEPKKPEPKSKGILENGKKIISECKSIEDVNIAKKELAKFDWNDADIETLKDLISEKTKSINDVKNQESAECQ